MSVVVRVKGLPPRASAAEICEFFGASGLRLDPQHVVLVSKAQRSAGEVSGGVRSAPALQPPQSRGHNWAQSLLLPALACWERGGPTAPVHLGSPPSDHPSLAQTARPLQPQALVEFPSLEAAQQACTRDRDIFSPKYGDRYVRVLLAEDMTPADLRSAGLSGGASVPKVSRRAGGRAGLVGGFVSPQRGPLATASSCFDMSKAGGEFPTQRSGAGLVPGQSSQVSTPPPGPPPAPPPAPCSRPRAAGGAPQMARPRQ